MSIETTYAHRFCLFERNRSEVWNVLTRHFFQNNF